METSSSSSNKPALSVHVIFNASSGTAPADPQTIRETFSQYPHVSCAVHESSSGRDIDHITKKALQAGADVIAAAGGDGTVSSVAHLLVEKETPLAILPLGTRNHFARDLGIPSDLSAAVEVVCSGKTVPIDVAEVNGRYFVNNVSLGAYADVVQLRDRWKPIIGKWPGMGLAIFALLFRMPWLPLQVEWKGHLIRRFVPLLFVGNNPYESRLKDIGKRLDLNKGVLWLMVPKETGVWGRIRAIAYALAGHMYDTSDIDVAEIKELVVRSPRRSMIIGLDGEALRSKMPLVFRSHPGALRVRAPNDVQP